MAVNTIGSGDSTMHSCKRKCSLLSTCDLIIDKVNILIYYIPINDTTFDLSVFWPPDTESRINELRFSASVSLSFKTRLKSVNCFCGDVT